MLNQPEVKVRYGGEVAPDEIRLYICSDCKQIIPIESADSTIVPPYKYDYLLHRIEEDHGWRGHNFAVISVNKDAWDDADGSGRKTIVANIQAAAKNGGSMLSKDGFLGEDLYQVKDQFKEDALTCWKQHNRTLNCDDWKTPPKLVEPDTKALRKSEGLAQYRSNIHICNWCPVTSMIEAKIRADKVRKDY